MSQHFMYVFDEDARDVLLNLNFELLKSDTDQNVYVFANNERRDFSCMNIEYMLTDILTF